MCKASEACAAAEWESKPHAAGETERECTPITQCVQGEYMRVAATETSDQECRACGDQSPESYAGGCTTTTQTTTSKTTTSRTTTSGTSTTTTTQTDTTTTTTTTTTATVTSTTVSTTTNTDTTTTIPIAVLKTAGVSAEALWRKHGASAADLAEAGFTVAEVVGAGLSAEEIAAAADFFEDATGATAADFHAVQGITAEMLKGEGFGALELMEGGFTAPQLLDAGYADVVVSAASTSYADSLKNPNATTNVVVAVAAVLILLVVVAAAFSVHRKKIVGDGGAQAGFENPMYDSNQPAGTHTFMETSAHGSSGYVTTLSHPSYREAALGYWCVASPPFEGGTEQPASVLSGAAACFSRFLLTCALLMTSSHLRRYMDIPAAGTGGGGGGSAGYMDVTATAASAGYMDVSPQAHAQGGSDSDEEV